MTNNPSAETERYQGDWFDRGAYWLFVKLPLFLLKWGLIIMGILLLIVWVKVTFGANFSHGDNIMDFVHNVRYAQYEFHGEFKMDGEKTLETTNEAEDTVEVFPVLSLYSRAVGLGKFVTVHNHPGWNEDNPPSSDDLLVSCVTRPTQDLIITSQSVHCIEAPNGWPGWGEMRNYLEELTHVYEDEQGWLKYRSSRNNLIEVFRYPEALQQLLDRFGLVYTVTPVDEWSFNSTG